MAFQNAKGDGKATGMPVQPRPVAPDEVSSIRNPSQAGLGMNGFAGPSSDTEIGKTVSPLGLNLRASVTDDAIGEVIAHGTAKQDVSVTAQLRKISADAPPPSYGMRLANSGGAPMGTVPAKLGANEGQPVRKPGQ